MRCAPWLQAALDEGGNVFDLEDVLGVVMAGQAQFWPGRAGAMVTEIIAFPKAKALRCWLAGGDLHELIERMTPEVEAWGRAQGCTRFIVCGRKGWERALRESGYLPKYMQLEKVIQ